MANLFRSREGPVPDDDVKTQLITLGSQTAPGPLLVPGGAKFIRAVYLSGVTSLEGTDSYAWLIRLEGPGVDRGVFTLAAGAGGVQVATGGHSLIPAVRIPINIKAIEGQEVLVFAEALGGDMGTSEFGVTVEFGNTAGDEGETKGEVTVEGDIAAVDTLTRLTTQGSVAAPSRLTPPDAKMLKRIIYAVSEDSASDGEVTFILRLGGDAIRGGEQAIIIGGASSIAAQSGSDEAAAVMVPQILDNLDLEITPNETLDISVEMAGIDIGTATIVVTAIFQ